MTTMPGSATTNVTSTPCFGPTTPRSCATWRCVSAPETTLPTSRRRSSWRPGAASPRLRYRGRPVLAWLYRVAANMASDRLRERMREPLPTDVVTGPPVADASDRVADRDVLGRALQALPADQQLAVHLRLVEGYSFAEVGRVMGRSAGACQMLVLRAGRQLREALEREGVHASG